MGVEPINLLELEDLAREKMPQGAFDYMAGGAQDEVTLRANRAAFERISLRYRVLTDVSRCDSSTTVLGEEIALPVLIAPVALQAMAHEEAEIATTRAAGGAGTIMVLSTVATTSIEEVAESATGPLWFQLYVQKDRGATAALVKRAEAAGCSALMLTVDAPRLGRRERDLRNAYHPPADLMAKNLLPAKLKRLPKAIAEQDLTQRLQSWLDDSLSWKDIEWLRSLTGMPLLIKGIVRADDAVLAVEHGAAGIVVSNHGGRQLDTAVATIDVLEEVVSAVDGRAEVLVDGGIRRGTDIVKAIALGAKAVLVGRPVVWGLAIDGEQGVARVLEILRDELDLAMALCGATRIDELGRDLIAR
jgi:4-hydroxymandelate oxidase